MRKCSSPVTEISVVKTEISVTGLNTCQSVYKGKGASRNLGNQGSPVDRVHVLRNLSKCHIKCPFPIRQASRLGRWAMRDEVSVNKVRLAWQGGEEFFAQTCSLLMLNTTPNMLDS